jgi:dihydrofolate reductase
MIISLIVCMDQNGVIGSTETNGLPWARKMPDDLRRFRNITMGKPIIFGRTTWEGINLLLPGRSVAILSKTLQDIPAFASTMLSAPDQLIDSLVRYEHPNEIVICGGAQTYQAFWPYVSRVYLTKILADVPGDVSFPEGPLDELEHSPWRRKYASSPLSSNGRDAYPSTFQVLEDERSYFS